MVVLLKVVGKSCCIISVCALVISFQTLHHLFEELVPGVMVIPLVVLKFLLILCRYRGNGDYTGRKVEEIVNHGVTGNA